MDVLRKLLLVLGLATLLTAISAGAWAVPDDDYERPVTRVDDYGWVQQETVWKVLDLTVCWENPDNRYSSQMELVRTAVEETWQRYSQMRFHGWAKCTAASIVGIRINIADVNPHTITLGSKLSNKPGGMVLNFEFHSPATFESCNADNTMYALCVRSIAVHEFGHALGFAHEHNRTDRDVSCVKAPQGPDGDTILTPYDPDSVMNYCNPRYNNFGKLSYSDVVSIQKIYGAPQP